LRYIASDVHLSAQREFQCGTVFVKNIYIYIYIERERERERERGNGGMEKIA